jgi:MFS family permease
MFFKKLDIERLPKDTKKAVALVLMGNFLEYFDLMLGVHLAMILNKVFLPQDTGYEHILRPMTFLLPLLMRPFAAIIWGYIGDNLGRKVVLTATMIIMGASCLFLTFVPTYAVWGITSTFTFFTIRSIQAFASAGELVGADVYIAETVPAPRAYATASFVEVTAGLGGLLACIVGAFTTFVDPINGWRYAFVIGASIAVLGSLARKDLKETPEFLKKKSILIDVGKTEFIENKIEQFRIKNIGCMILMYAIFGFVFFFVYSYCNSLLEKKFAYSTSHVLMVSASIITLKMVSTFTFGRIALRVCPRKLLRVIYGYLFIIGLALSLYPNWHESSFNIRLLQYIISLAPGGLDMALPLFMKSYATNKKMQASLWGWAISKTMIYFVTAVLCATIGDLNILLVILSFVAACSYIGVHLFKTYDQILTPKECSFINSFQKIKIQTNNSDLA